MADAFISYSRRDAVFVEGLAAALEGRGKTVWLDTEGIEAGEVFPLALQRAIEGSDAFVFVITPDSVASRFCTQEIEHAQTLGEADPAGAADQGAGRGVACGDTRPQLDLLRVG